MDLGDATNFQHRISVNEGRCAKLQFIEKLLHLFAVEDREFARARQVGDQHVSEPLAQPLPFRVVEVLASEVHNGQGRRRLRRHGEGGESADNKQ